MDPLMKMYMFYHWLEDNNEQIELFKNHGYLIGSFTNPEAVKKLMDGNIYSVSEEEFENTSQLVSDTIRRQEKEKQEKQVNPRKRRRKVVQ